LPGSRRPRTPRFRSLAPGLGHRIEEALEDPAHWRNPVTILRPVSKHQLIQAFVRAHPDRGYQPLTFYRWTDVGHETHPKWPRLRTLAQDLGVPVSWLGFGKDALDELELLMAFRQRRHGIPPPS
jgi:hypothetical protein